MVNAGQVISKTQIRDEVWEYGFDGRVNMVEVYISYLRKKLDALGPPLIRTVRGIGYSFRPERQEVARSPGEGPGR
jgi:two-component system OmpR family response regulator